MEVQNTQFGPEGPRSLWRNRLFSAGLAMFYAGARLLRLDRRGRRNALDIQLVTRSISFPDLPRAFEGYRILHLSDTHLDCLPELAAVASRLITGVEVDLLVLTGDIHGRQRAPLADSTGPLAELIGAVRVKDRYLAILGNHDPAAMAETLEDLVAASSPAEIDQRRGAMQVRHSRCRRGAITRLTTPGSSWVLLKIGKDKH